ncbi:MAG: hypothetical protein J07HR59_01066 [Halorubrum sp. J07HR59]|nr:MAG: hypothetical protein J07HR59_01066 [Halorubrum sp. J07HR59]
MIQMGGRSSILDCSTPAPSQGVRRDDGVRAALVGLSCLPAAVTALREA